jgi:DNA-binding response OmpR family regulator
MPEIVPLPAHPPDGKFRVLIVEDDPFIGRLILTNLTKAGLQGRLATDGIDGLAEFKNFEPHLVLSDIMMPGIDGRQLCATIRGISLIPIILITAADTSEAELNALKSGADDYIAKPFEPKTLVARVMTIIRRVYRYDVQAHQSVGTQSVVPAAGQAPAGHWVSCNSCGYIGPHEKFRKENSKGQRYMMCPHCQEMEHLTFQNHG